MATAKCSLPCFLRRGESSGAQIRYQGPEGISPPEGKTLHLWAGEKWYRLHALFP
jgi:hypothetical protein